VATIPTGAYPEGIDALGDRVWVVSWMDEVLIALDARTLKVTARVPLGSNPRGFGRFVLAE
jgi:YVTN family beta-propeller protein